MTDEATKSRPRSAASEVWEIPLSGGTLRVLLKRGQETMVRLEVLDSSRVNASFFVELDAQAWRSLCDLRAKIRPARQRRSTP